MNQNKISKKDRYMVLIASLLLIVSCIILKLSLFYGFLGSIALSFVIFLKNGFSSKELLSMIKQGLIECKILYGLIILIGATISIWLCSGIVPTMIYYGLEYMKGINFLFAAFIITSIISVFMGTAVGTISTIGLALLGIGKGFGIPQHILLGAIISGAFIADKVSPISGLFNLTLTTTKTTYRQTIKSMFTTLIPIYLITSVIYMFIGKGYNGALEGSDLYNLQVSIKEAFYISPFLLILPIMIVIMAFLGVETTKAILIGLSGGIVVSFSLQNIDFINIIRAILWGYKGTTATAELNEILISGGIISMIEVILIVMGAIALSSLFEGAGIIQPIINNIISKVRSKKELILKTGLISSILTIITCDQTVGIILPGRLLKEKYRELDVDNTVLARTISDTGTIIAPLMPWNVNALIILIISGVTALDYAPYAVLCYVSPAITIMLAYLTKFQRQKLRG
ncbi:Na+/H+ antiporter NhaC family protein [Paramaledivibacter caminithermalis]|jgi:NhaC family Na+:H+ antiporter|uniref:Transporter, NhaC family n=1 Tax=Paramaledivibacter caminithermalis (strain DSM 15212 / CIP 107654 / DViRD3) TaxID=1121301 RepID=A0A1M6P830_PARC5|nr:Na+/H+ antiporter NhaC family protein [Paramaledivibacter caminithermalis]SHK04086.1 transporter, NhaC family [Paramaledivibacter caminithermalis DSM 15212]